MKQYVAIYNKNESHFPLYVAVFFIPESNQSCLFSAWNSNSQAHLEPSVSLSATRALPPVVRFS